MAYNTMGPGANRNAGAAGKGPSGGSYQNSPTQQLIQKKAAEDKVASSTANTLKLRPKEVAYESIRDAGGALKSQYQLKDPGAVQSPWLAQQLQQQQAMQTNQINQGQAQAATAAAQAQSGLARRGGLSSGAAERLGAQSAEQAALGAQDIRQAGDQQRLGMQTDDMKQEREFQGNLQQQNLQNTLGEIDAKRQFDLAQYTERMKGYGAEKSAKATAKACFLEGTPILLSDGRYQTIESIEPSSEIFAVMKCAFADGDRVYKYGDVFVTGDHHVFENGWVKVKDSIRAVVTTLKPKFVYNLLTKSKKIHACDEVFADYSDEIVAQGKTNVG